jgi:hypothetical protein
VFNEELDAHIHGVMAFTRWFGVFAFTLLYVYLLDRRYRLLALDEEREEREVQRAIAERIGVPAAAAAPAAPAEPGAAVVPPDLPPPVEVGVEP